MNYTEMPAHRFIVKNTQPVPIPGSAKKNLTEYSLKQNFFDPNKSSPPNSWNSRLLMRIEHYKSNDFNRIME